MSLQGGIDETVHRGRVEWFHDSRGYGFIRPDDGGPDVWVHFSRIMQRGFKTLTPGQRVTYLLSPPRQPNQGPRAIRVFVDDQDTAA